MKKLVLNVDELSVQSFDTSAARKGSGTVFGNYTDYYEATCGVADSCHATYCGDCNATDPNVDCGDGGSGDCPSVNIANCASAYYTDCCERYTSRDFWGGYGTACS